MVARGPVVKLFTGAEMPLVGLGTWLSSKGEVGKAVKIALDCGYRLIDTAQIYGNEKEIGDALQAYFKSGKLKREEVFITTKLWCTHFHPNEVEGALRDSLKKLQVDQVDLYLAHVPGAFNNAMTEQDHSITVESIWKSLEEVHKKGLTKAIGVSNFSTEQIERIVKIATVPIHNCQAECYLYFPQFDLVDVCKRHNISFTAYAPIGSPGRGEAKLDSGAKLEWKPAPMPLEDPLVKKLAEKYHKTSAQILLRHLLQRDLAVIPKSVNEKRIKENWDIFDFKLTEDEMKALNTPKHNQRLFLQDFLEGHPEDPFKKDRQ